MNVYKFIDVSTLPDGAIPIIIIASLPPDGTKIRAVLDEGFLFTLRGKSIAERTRVIKELLSVIEKSIILSLAEDKAVSSCGPS